MRNSRSMPQWAVQEPNGRVGPKPPAPPAPGYEGGVPPRVPPKKPMAEPDYEVIEFGAQQQLREQYSNAQPLKLPPAGSKPPLKCELCGSLQPKYRCELCKNQILCTSCDDMFHRHPKRKTHFRTLVELPPPPVSMHVRPPLPPKGEHAVPVPPPRRKQKISLACPGAQSAPPNMRLETPPSPSLSLRERIGTLKRMIVPGNRTNGHDDQMSLRSGAPPLPARPPPSSGSQTRPITPLGGNPFDAIQKPPSLTMEKIKQQQSATLDRMSMLQQRYRQSQLNLHTASLASAEVGPQGCGRAQLMAAAEPKRRVSSASQVDLRMLNGRRASYTTNTTTNTDFASASSDQWSNHSSTLMPRMRAGSMATGMNTATSRSLQQQHAMFAANHGGNSDASRTGTLTRQSPGMMGSDGPERPHTAMSHSVFDLQQQQQHNMGFNPAHPPGGNCLSCSQQQLNWTHQQQQQQHQHHQLQQQSAYPGSHWDMNAHQLNGSNMSLNIHPSSYYPQQPHAQPPPSWFNGWAAPAPPGMYPGMYPMGMVPMMQPDFRDQRSRGPSRSQSRAVSPSMSMKSRKSMQSGRQQPAAFPRAHSFVGGHRLTNDEADTLSDEDYVDDFRSATGSSSRRNSSISAVMMRRNRHQSTASSADPDVDSAADAAAAAATIAKQRSPPHRRLSYRERRSGSAVRTAGKVSTATSTTEQQQQPVQPTAVMTASLPDSGSESGTRALVQAKIAQKIAVQQSSVDESSSDFWKQTPKAVDARATKTSTAEPPPPTSVQRKVSDQIEPEIMRIISDANVGHTVDNTVADADEAGPVGPPPTTPDFEWECEFCTFVNEPHTKICVVCCKTPVAVPARKTPVPAPAPAEPAAETAIPVSVATFSKETSPSSSGDRTKEIPMAPKHWLDETTDDDQSTHHIVQVHVAEVHVQPEIVEEKAAEDIGNNDEVSITKDVDIPTMQIIETIATHEDIETIKELPEAETIVEQLHESDQKQTHDEPVESKPIVIESPTVTIVTTPDVSLPEPSGDSHLTSNCNIELTASLPSAQPSVTTPSHPQLDDSILAYIDQSLRKIKEVGYLSHPASTAALTPTINGFNSSDRHLHHGSYNELHELYDMQRRSPYYDSSMDRVSPYLIQHNPSHHLHGQPDNSSSSDSYMSHKRNYSDQHAAGSPSHAYAQRSSVNQSDPLAHLLHEARQNLFGPEELQAALMHCGTAHPVAWLHENWPRLVETVQTLATKYGQELHDGPTNRIGVLSASEARDALRQHHGNVGLAVTECVQQRESKYAEIVARGVYDNVDIVAALSAHHGQVNMALLELAKRWNRPHRPTNDILNFVNRNIVLDGNEPTPEGSTISEFSGGSSVSTGVEKSVPNVQPPGESLPLAAETAASVVPADTHSSEPESPPKSPNMLRDIETLIGNMERNHMRQNEDMLRTIEDMLKQQQPQQHVGEADAVTNHASNEDDEHLPPLPETENGDFAFFSERIEADDDVKEYYGLDRIEEDQSDEVDTTESSSSDKGHLNIIVTTSTSFTPPAYPNTHTTVPSTQDLALSITAKPLLSVAEEPDSITEEPINQKHATLNSNSVEIVSASQPTPIQTISETQIIDMSAVEQIGLKVDSLENVETFTFNEQFSFILPAPIYTTEDDQTNILENIDAPEQFSFVLPSPVVPIQFEAAFNIDNIVLNHDEPTESIIYETIIGTTSELPEQMSTDGPVSDDISVAFDFQSSNDIFELPTVMSEDIVLELATKQEDLNIVDENIKMKPTPEIVDTSSSDNVLNVINNSEHTKIPLPTFDEVDEQTVLDSNISKIKGVTNEKPTVLSEETILTTDIDEIQTISTENELIIPDEYVVLQTTAESNQESLNSLEPHPMTPLLYPQATTDETNEVRQPDEVDPEKPAERMNLSDMVLDTQKLIQQMRDELNSDIATFTSEDEDGGSADDEDDYDERDDTYTLSGGESGEEWSEEYDEEGEMEEENASYTDEEGKHISDYTDDEVPPESDGEYYEEEIEIVQIDIEHRNGHADEGRLAQTPNEFAAIMPPDEFLDQQILAANTRFLENSESTPLHTNENSNSERNVEPTMDMNTSETILQRTDSEIIATSIPESINEEPNSLGQTNKPATSTADTESTISSDVIAVNVVGTDTVDETPPPTNTAADIEDVFTTSAETTSVAVTELPNVSSQNVEFEIESSAVNDADVIVSNESIITENIDSTYVSTPITSLGLSAQSPFIADSILGDDLDVITENLDTNYASTSNQSVELPTQSPHSADAILGDDLDGIATNERIVTENIDTNVRISTATVRLSTESPSIVPDIVPESIITTEVESPAKKPTTSKKSASSNSSQTTTKSTKNATKVKIAVGSKTTKNTGMSAVSTVPKPGLAKKIPIRKASLPGVLGSLSTMNVRAMQKEFLNKSTPPAVKPTSAFNNGRPSKIVPPKVYPKPGTVSSALSERITKFIKPLTTANSKESNTIANKTTNGQHIINNGAGTSTSSAPSQNVAGGSRTANDTKLSIAGGSKHNPKILKKKYLETCFSDDYQSSSSGSEDLAPARIPSASDRPMMARRQQSMPNIMRTELEEEEEISVEQRSRRLLADRKVANYLEAQLAAELMAMKFPLESAVWAAGECNTLEQALDLLQKECELCTGRYPLTEFVTMLQCEHSCCQNCARHYFTIQITERSLNDCTCPYCKLPEVYKDDVMSENDVLDYFGQLYVLLRPILDDTVHNLFQQKLRDRALEKDPNFKWCVQCSSGFIARPRQKRLICPDCGTVTCSQCNKTWEPQHEGITCDQFTDWKASNDPESQAEGVYKHLQMYGIDCPKCKFRFSLSRGGCIHFTCSQCKYEFCYGCGKPFHMGTKCGVAESCGNLGLHAHHPRNCMFYLRDKEPRDLQTLLTMHEIPFNVQTPVAEDASTASATTKCSIAIQKETPAGLVDTICHKDIEKDQAGMCRVHYVEYLCFLISHHKLESLSILSTDDLEICVRRANRRMPPRPYGILNSFYHKELAKHYVEYLGDEIAKANIDPLPIFDLADCIVELKRRGIALPERGPWDTDEIYRGMCQKIVEQQIPLD